MKKIKLFSKKILTAFGITVLLLTVSCNEDLLTEVPKDFLSPNVTYKTQAGFEAGLAALYDNARGYVASGGGIFQHNWVVPYGQGTDVGWNIVGRSISDYRKLNSFDDTSLEIWIKSYSVVKDANTIITRAEAEDVEWNSEEEKNRIIGEAKFFRAYAYRLLVHMFGAVPIIREELTGPKLDFVRDPVDDVLAFMLEDLEFGAQNLPAANPDGARVTKAAANYLLAETYIATKQWDKAIAAANNILNDSQYDLMYERFGSMIDKPGDVYWDLFRYRNQDRSSGNKENIFAWQFEYNVDGGAALWTERAWGPFLERLKTPDNMQAILKDEFLGRPVCFIRITPWVETGMWNDFNNDIRNSEYNVHRTFYINNPESAYYGDTIEQTANNYVREMFPYYRKFTMEIAHPQGYDTGGNIYNDWYVFRVAGVYLLRAEAYLGKGDKNSAAADINVVRGRANASPVAPADVDIDYILDERVRELLGEEVRWVSLSRTGKVVERTRRLNPVSGPTMEDYNRLLPIPQVEIDANVEAELTQNPGYN